ncbi:MAG: RNA-binding protein [Lachnospiraceae bacterium]
MLTFAVSRAGHDKNHIYCVLKEEKDVVYLVNGKTKTIEHPKKKKKLHIQMIRRIPEFIQMQYQEGMKYDPEQAVRQALYEYQQWNKT